MRPIACKSTLGDSMKREELAKLIDIEIFELAYLNTYRDDYSKLDYDRAPLKEKSRRNAALHRIANIKNWKSVAKRRKEMADGLANLKFPDNPNDTVNIRIKQTTWDNLNAWKERISTKTGKTYSIDESILTLIRYAIYPKASIEKPNNYNTLYCAFIASNPSTLLPALMDAKYKITKADGWKTIRIKNGIVYYLDLIRYSNYFNNDSQPLAYLLGIWSNEDYYDYIKSCQDHIINGGSITPEMIDEADKKYDKIVIPANIKEILDMDMDITKKYDYLEAIKSMAMGRPLKNFMENLA